MRTSWFTRDLSITLSLLIRTTRHRDRRKGHSRFPATRRRCLQHPTREQHSGADFAIFYLLGHLALVGDIYAQRQRLHTRFGSENVADRVPGLLFVLNSTSPVYTSPFTPCPYVCRPRQVSSWAFGTAPLRQC